MTLNNHELSYLIEGVKLEKKLKSAENLDSMMKTEHDLVSTVSQ